MEGGGGLRQEVGTLRAEAALTAMCVRKGERGRGAGVGGGMRAEEEMRSGVRM